jgi:hypothetical protein
MNNEESTRGLPIQTASNIEARHHGRLALRPGSAGVGVRWRVGVVGKVADPRIRYALARRPGGLGQRAGGYGEREQEDKE